MSVDVRPHMEMWLLFGVPIVLLVAYTTFTQVRAHRAMERAAAKYEGALETQRQAHALLTELVALQKKTNEQLDSIARSLEQRS